MGAPPGSAEAYADTQTPANAVAFAARVTSPRISPDRPRTASMPVVVSPAETVTAEAAAFAGCWSYQTGTIPWGSEPQAPKLMRYGPGTMPGIRYVPLLPVVAVRVALG